MRRSCVTAAGVAVLILALAGAAEPQAPLRIGGSMSITGAYAPIGQNVLRGYQLCVKHTNERGGLLGRRLVYRAEDDQSQAANAVRIYETLLRDDKVDGVFSPYSSPITDAVAEVTERRHVPLVACCAATTAIYRKGRRYIFMLTSPGHAYLEGVIDLAAKRGLTTLALLHEATLLPKAIAEGAIALARRRNLRVVLTHAYARGTTDFSTALRRMRELDPDVIAAPGYFEDAIAVVRQMKELGVSPRMFAVTSGGDLLRFYQTLGKSAEFVYGPSKWEPELVTLRAGGLVPIARQYPGARELVQAHRREFPDAGLSYQTAEGYGACQIFVEAVKRAGSLDPDRIRETLLNMDLNTVFGGFRVDQDGVQTAHRMLTFQWQDGKKVIVWPEELTPHKPRFPTPPWSQRP